MAQLVPVDTFDLVIFGGTGDLAMRKLLPALYHRDGDDQLPGESRIISVSRLDMASPRPVPPNLRVVDVSAWEND